MLGLLRDVCVAPHTHGTHTHGTHTHGTHTHATHATHGTHARHAALHPACGIECSVTPSLACLPGVHESLHGPWVCKHEAAILPLILSCTHVCSRCVTAQSNLCMFWGEPYAYMLHESIGVMGCHGVSWGVMGCHGVMGCQGVMGCRGVWHLLALRSYLQIYLRGHNTM